MTEFEIRQPCARDIAPLARIIGKIGVGEFKAAITPEAIQSALAGTSGASEQISLVGMGVVLDVVSIVCENLYKAEDDVFKLLADFAGLEKDEVACLPLADFADLAAAVFKSEGFADFFTRVSSLAK